MFLFSSSNKKKTREAANAEISGERDKFEQLIADARLFEVLGEKIISKEEKNKYLDMLETYEKSARQSVNQDHKLEDTEFYMFVKSRTETLTEWLKLKNLAPKELEEKLTKRSEKMTSLFGQLAQYDASINAFLAQQPGEIAGMLKKCREDTSEYLPKIKRADRFISYLGIVLEQVNAHNEQIQKLIALQPNEELKKQVRDREMLKLQQAVHQAMAAPVQSWALTLRGLVDQVELARAAVEKTGSEKKDQVESKPKEKRLMLQRSMIDAIELESVGPSTKPAGMRKVGRGSGSE